MHECGGLSSKYSHKMEASITRLHLVWIFFLGVPTDPMKSTQSSTLLSVLLGDPSWFEMPEIGY